MEDDLDRGGLGGVGIGVEVEVGGEGGGENGPVGTDGCVED